jgi:hypothetical protein
MSCWMPGRWIPTTFCRQGRSQYVHILLSEFPIIGTCVVTYKDYNADHGKILGSMGCQEWQGYRVVV